MPASNPRCIYFDACVLLAYIGNEAGRADVVEALLEDGRKNQIQIVTSVLTITEVAFGAQERDAGLTPDGEAKIDTLWQPASPITLVDVSEATTRAARGLIREAKSKGAARVRPFDALHLASARLVGVEEFFTYEETKTRNGWTELTGLTVSEPSVANPHLEFEH